jgi:hypothetical protein
MFAIALVILAYQASSAAPGGRQTFSIRDEIETARFKINERKESVFVSPDGTGYVSMLIRGDVASDGVWGKLFMGNSTPSKVRSPKRSRGCLPKAWDQARDSAPRGVPADCSYRARIAPCGSIMSGSLFCGRALATEFKSCPSTSLRMR